MVFGVSAKIDLSTLGALEDKQRKPKFFRSSKVL